MLELQAIVAIGLDWTIGHDGALPWRLPDDLAWFKRVTAGAPVIMGRATHQSIGRALPGRLNVVMSRTGNAALADGCVWASSLTEALVACRDHPRATIIGGREVYAQMLPLVDTLHLTVVHASPAGDVRLLGLN